MRFENEIQIILQKMKLFKGLSGDELNIIAPYGKRLKFERNKTIIKEGGTNPGLHVLISGEMEVLLPKGAKKRNRFSDIHLCKMERGDYVGEYSLIDHEPASAAVVAKEDCLIFYISCRKFDELIENNDLIGRKIFHSMLEVLVKRARNYDQELDLIV
jgi:CRP-like cAMP-binding protein